MEFIPTLDSDSEIVGDESESDEEEPKKSTSLFTEGFEFGHSRIVDEDDLKWDINDELLQMATKRQNPQLVSLDEKIAKAREARRLKTAQEKGDAQHKHTVKKNETPDNDANENAAESSDDSENTDSECDDPEQNSMQLETSDEEIEDSVKVKKSKSKTASVDSFFAEPPPLKSDVNFSDMNLSRPLLKAVTALGFVSPTPIQGSCIPVALMGKDICACAATGTGKTAAFMLPILERLLFRPTHTRITRILILTPTRELAIQVTSVGKSLSRHTDVEFCLATGGLDNKTQEAMLRKHPDVIVATPGRLVDHLHNSPSFTLNTIEILVLDEADRMLDVHFEDQLNEIIKLCPKSRQTMLFSATMTDQVEELARLSLNHPVRLFVDGNMDVADNLRQEFVRIKAKKESDREIVVTALCCRTFKEHCLIFLNTKKAAHRLRILFGMLGLKANELHGNLSQLQRIEAVKQFKEGEVDFLVATDLAARGLDIEKVKTVINFNMPSTEKQYIHRVGRTARAGRRGRSVSLVGEKERKLLKDIIKHAKCPVKSRVLPQEVILKYRVELRKLQPDIKEILRQEEEEKQLRVTEMEVNKAQNLIEHEEEIFSRPAKTWIKASRKRTAVAAGVDSEVPALSRKKPKRDLIKSKTTSETADEKTERLRVKYECRVAKRAVKKKKATNYSDNKSTKSPKIDKMKPRPVISSFDRDLTNTSKKNLRMSGSFSKVQKGNKFKSKKRYKRR